MNVVLRVLMLEDSDTDAELTERALRRGGIEYVVCRVETEPALIEALDTFAPDIVLADYALPTFDGISALRIVRERSAELPFILLSGTLGDERAVEALKLGATDYVLKDRLGRLAAAVERAHNEALAAAEKRRANEALRFRSEFESVIARLSTEFIRVASSELDALIETALARIGELANADRAFVRFFSRDRLTVESSIEWTREGIAPQKVRVVGLPLVAIGFTMQYLESGVPLFVADVAALPQSASAEYDLLAAQDVVSFVIVPMRSHQELIGFVGFHAVARTQSWSDDTIAMLQVVATIFSNALERKRAEDALRAEQEFVSRVFNTAPTLIVIVDEEGVVVRVNRAFERATGYAARDVLGRSLGALQLIENSVLLRPMTFRKIMNSGTVEHTEGTLTARDGTKREAMWHATAIRTPEGEAEHVVIMGVDETARHRLEAQLEQSRRIESLGRVAATIAHEFNNVLMSIQPYTDLIRRHATDEKTQSYAERIAASVHRGQRVTEEVMRFTRRIEPSLRPTTLGDWLQTFVDEVRVVVAERTGGRVALVLEVPQPLPPVLVDAAQLYQVFSNLVVNAADAMPDGGVVTIAATDAAAQALFNGDSHGFVHLRVSDTGSGIAPEALQHVFEPFFTTKEKGNGIGLAAAHQIITAFGGHIYAESHLGRGTTFHMFVRHAS
jgi:two-component system cell cycle sensor histidine kinase/response regulator CckA